MNRSRTVLIVGAALAMAALYALQPSSGEPPTASPIPSALAMGAASPTATPGRPTAAPTSPTAAPVRPAPSPSAAAGAGTRIAGTVAVRIEVPRLGIDLPIVEGDGVSAPEAAAAHYPGTAWPGAGSNTYLYAHAREGLFLSLWEAVEGDRILLTLADGGTACFEVDRIDPALPWNDLSVLLPTDHERLTLQTSTSYTPTAPRFLVVALPCASG